MPRRRRGHRSRVALWAPIVVAIALVAAAFVIAPSLRAPLPTAGQAAPEPAAELAPPRVAELAPPAKEPGPAAPAPVAAKAASAQRAPGTARKRATRAQQASRRAHEDAQDTASEIEVRWNRAKP